VSNKQRRKFILELAVRTAVIFTVGIVALSLAGVIYSRVPYEGNDIPALFAYSNAGLPYSYLLVLAGAALVVAFLSILFAELVFVRRERKHNRYEKLFKRYKFDKKKPLTN